MPNIEANYDHRRYKRLLAEAIDEQSRLALIELLIEEGARDQLSAQLAFERAAMTASTIARMLGTPRG
jgi:hypothetical protein